jgi:large conductance mechanosensitive channel
MKSLLEEFRDFLFKGNLIALAVAFIIATAFATLVKALIADLITPIIALIFGKPDFGGLSFTINSSHFYYGDFVNALITFVAVGVAVFFFVAKPYEAFQARRATDDPSIKACPECTTEIPAAAKRCPQCTAVLDAPEAVAAG